MAASAINNRMLISLSNLFYQKLKRLRRISVPEASA
jgi:hypothetical protein